MAGAEEQGDEQDGADSAAAHGEIFAAQLRALKERSGRSYGALAGRLHMSVSTLHRYCNGDAVPADYAPVERLARLCGATDDELVELHRRWLRADAARRRPGGGRRTTAAARTPAWAKDATAAKGATATNGAGAKPSPIAKPTPVTDPTDDGTPPPWLVRHRTIIWPAVAAAALVLALVATAVFAPPHDERAGARGDGSVGAPRQDGGAYGEGKPGGGGKNPYASPHSSGAGTPADERDKSASPGAADREGSGGGSKDAGAGGDGSGGDGTEQATPLAATTRSHVWDYGCNHTYLVDKSPSSVPPPPVQQDAASWANSLAAVHGGNTTVETTLEPSGSAPVVVESVNVRVAGRTAPAKLPAFEMSNGCGGLVSEAYFKVNLDANRPVPQPVNGYDGKRKVPPAELPYQVTEKSPLALRVRADTSAYDARWYLEVEWTSGGRSGTTRIDDAGRPFRTSSTKGLKRYGYALEERRWVSD